MEFFPADETPREAKISALLRAAEGLKPDDLDELRRYAEFRKARGMFAAGSRSKPGRKRKKES